jgi:hypothetical protein
MDSGDEPADAVAALEQWMQQHARIVGVDGAAVFCFLLSYAHGRKTFNATRNELLAQLRGVSRERFTCLVKRCATAGLVSYKRQGNVRTSLFEILQAPEGWVPAPLRDEPFSIPQATPRSRRREAQ